MHKTRCHSGPDSDVVEQSLSSVSSDVIYIESERYSIAIIRFFKKH